MVLVLAEAAPPLMMLVRSLALAACCLALVADVAVAPQASVGGTAEERAQRILAHQQKLAAGEKEPSNQPMRATVGSDTAAKRKAAPPPVPPPPPTAAGVAMVTGKNYHDFLQQPGFKFVKFLAPWCAHRWHRCTDCPSHDDDEPLQPPYQARLHAGSP